MNRIYKVIYSKARQCYIVVSELAKSNHKSSQQGADHTNTPALARIIAVALAAGALTWGSVPGVSWAAGAENKAGTGNGIAIGDGSRTSEDNAIITLGKNQIAIGVGAHDETDGSAPGDASIAIGAGAHTYNELGRRAATISFGKDLKDYTGGIAIGTKTYAITGGTSIGQRDYNGVMGDITVSDKNRDNLQYAPGATSLGSNAYAGGTLATVIGAYNISTSGYDGSGGTNSAYYVAQNLGSTILGTLNTNESAQAKDTKLVGYYDIKSKEMKAKITPSSSGIANSIIGVANEVEKSNGSIVLGAGNTVSNSSTKIVDDIEGSYDELKNWQPTSYKSVNDMAQVLRDKVKSSKSGGATLVIGGGNTAENTLKTQIIGVNNTVKGSEDTPSDYNMIDGFNSTITGASHLYTIGSNNNLTDVSNSILFGNNYSGSLSITGLKDSVIIGNSAASGRGYVPFSNVKNIVSLGNGNIMSRTDDAVAIGSDNIMKRDGAESYGYDTGNVAIGNNTYINSYVNQGDSIVIGKNATVVNMNGSLEKAFAFGTPMGKDYSGSIAIGQNSYARSGSTMIGVHNYWGKLGDLDIDYATGNEGGEGSAHIAKYQESTNATTVGNNSYNNGVFSTVMGSYTAVSGFYHNEKWGEKPYGVQNFGAAVVGSLNSVEGLTSTEHNTAGMADSILGSANRTKNANGTIMVGAGNVVEDSINDFDASEIKTKDGIASPNALSEAMRTSIKSANGGGAAAIVGNGNEVKKSTNVAVMGSKNSVTSTTNSQIFGDNRAVTGADGAPIDGAVIIGSASGTTPMTTDKKNVTILGHNANATVEDGVALGAGSVASREAQVAGYDPSTKEASKDTSAVWRATNAAVSVGKADGSMTRQITGVAAGTNATDAVNVAQLKKAMASAGKDGNDTLVSNDKALSIDNGNLNLSIKDTANHTVTGSVKLSDIASAVADGNTTYEMSHTDNKEDNTTTITLKDSNNNATSVTVATRDTRNTVKAGDHVGVAESKNGDGSSTYTVSVKTDGKVEKDNTNIVNGGTVYNETRTASDGHYTKVTNTAGENILALDKQVKQNADTITNVDNRVKNLSSNVTNLNNRVSTLDSRVNKVGAGAAALAALHPLDFDPEDKWDFAVGYGNYRDANSVAVGAFYRPDDDTMFSVGTNFGNGENMINAGVSFKFGPKGKSQVRPGSTQEITELRATVARQDDQLKKQDGEIKELKAMVQQLLAAQDKKAVAK